MLPGALIQVTGTTGKHIQTFDNVLNSLWTLLLQQTTFRDHKCSGTFPMAHE